MLTNSPQKFLLSGVAIILLSALIQFWALRTNPPGFFLDESSVAYNAHTISHTGHDEHGVSWPLFFRAFGEFKNPVYVYALAGVFRLTGPGILAARVLSATLGLLTIVLLGLLAFRITQTRNTALIFSLLVLFTPWTFELSRLVLEVAIYPFFVALLLLAVWKAASRPVWSVPQICALAATLALLTYSYSIGRLFAPLLALSLVVFVTRRRLLGLLLTWIAYGVTLIPLFVFQQRNPGALTARFQYLSYLKPESTWTQVAREFTRRFFANLNPWRLFVSESAKTNELLHVPGPPAMLAVTAALVVVSVVLLCKRRQFDAWWRFVFCGLIASLVPASLTTDNFHMLRLAPLAVFLLVLTIPALQWLTEKPLSKRAPLNQRTVRKGATPPPLHERGHSPLPNLFYLAVVFLICGQGLFFQWRYHTSVTSPRRLHTFDADYPALILPSALQAAGSQPVYVADNPARPAYVQALWYATLWQIPLAKFVSLGFDQSAPEGAVVITTEERCPRCRVLASSEPYTTYVATGPARTLKRLSDDDMRAELSVIDPPTQLRAGQQTTIQVAVKNAGHSLWLAPERSGGDFRLSLGNHWLNADGISVVNDDGRNAISADVAPGAMTTMPLMINAPRRAGEYLLEVDMVQEGASWFGLKGSKTWRGKVTVMN